MQTYLSGPDKNRFFELCQKISAFSISDTEQQELGKLIKKGQVAAEKRDAAIQAIKQQLAEYAIGPDLLYSPREIRDSLGEEAAAPEPARRGRKPGKAAGAKAAARKPRGRPAKKAGAKKSAAKKARAPRAKSSAPVLIQIKLNKGAGAPVRYKQGQTLGPFVNKTYKALSSGRGLKANLANYYTDEGKAYFATPEGEAELGELIKFVQSGKTKP